MDPFSGFSGSEWRKVLRLAARMHARDRQRGEEQRRREEAFRAAEEVGIPEGYLRAAAEQVRAHRGFWHSVPFLVLGWVVCAGVLGGGLVTLAQRGAQPLPLAVGEAREAPCYAPQPPLGIDAWEEFRYSQAPSAPLIPDEPPRFAVPLPDPQPECGTYSYSLRVDPDIAGPGFAMRPPCCSPAPVFR